MCIFSLKKVEHFLRNQEKKLSLLTISKSILSSSRGRDDLSDCSNTFYEAPFLLVLKNGIAVFSAGFLVALQVLAAYKLSKLYVA